MLQKEANACPSVARSIQNKKQGVLIQKLEMPSLDNEALPDPSECKIVPRSQVRHVFLFVLSHPRPVTKVPRAPPRVAMHLIHRRFRPVY